MNITSSSTPHFKTWIKAVRPQTLCASIGPVVLSLSYVWHINQTLHWSLGLVTLLCALCLQIISNLVNDLMDYQSGVDKDRQLGPLRVTQSGQVTLNQIKVAIGLMIFLSTLFSGYLIYHGGWVLLLLFVLCLTTAIAYTAGPYPLSHYALGEVMAFIFFGPVALWGVAYLQMKPVPIDFIFLGLGPGFIAAQLMSINNLRDIESDSQTTKKTLAIFLGESKARKVPIIFLVLSQLIVLMMAFHYHVIFLIVLFTPWPFWFHWKRLLSNPITKDFNLSLQATGQYMAFYSLFMALIFALL